MTHSTCEWDQLGNDHYRCSLVIGDSMGLHIRPAARVAQIAMESNCTVIVRKGDREADGKSILELITLAAGPKGCLQVEAKGEKALQTLLAVAGTLKGESEDVVPCSPFEADSAMGLGPADFGTPSQCAPC